MVNFEHCVNFSFVLTLTLKTAGDGIFCDIELSLELLLILCGYFDAEW